MMARMSAVWDRTSAFVGANAAPLAAIALPTIYLATFASEVLTPLQEGAAPGSKLALGVVSLLLSLLGLYGQTAVAAAAIDPARARGGAFALANARFGAMLGVTVVLAIACAVLALPIVAILAANGVDPAAMATQAAPAIGPGALATLLLYALVLLVVLCWLFGRLLPLGGVVVAERRGLGAIGRAFRMTRGHALRIFGVLVLLGIVTAVAGLAAETVFGSVFRLLFGDGPGVTAAVVLTAIATAAVSTIATVILTAFAAELYLALAGADGGAVPAGDAVRPPA